jgi:translation initiation factor IF-2
MTKTTPQKNIELRPPVVAVMGHIDHGKSTLLDYIRKTNVTGGEAGGITQHLSAYEISVPHQGTTRGITFLDTPGHAAFSGMRERGATAADIAILVVSADDGVKAQTIEALKTIENAKIPFVVAINKIDKGGANIDRSKQMLAEQGVLVEGYGGTIPWVPISALKGTGVDELLDTILLVTEMENISGDRKAPVEGIVIESHLDSKRGIAGTIIVKNGVLEKGQFVVAGGALTTTRIMENFLGKTIDEAPLGTSVRIVGFDKAPEVGTPITVFDKKSDAEKFIEKLNTTSNIENVSINPEKKVVPIIIKTDVFGTTEAIENEIKKINVDGLYLKIINKGVGAINEGDVRMAQSDKDVIILGFNTDLDNRAKVLNENANVNIQKFNIIYKLTEWLAEELEKRRPRKETEEIIGTAKVLKTFSKTKEKQVLGCRVENGSISVGARVNIIRRDFPIATGHVVEIQQAKQKTREVSSGECGIMIECKNDIAPGDMLQAFVMVTK